MPKEDTKEWYLLNAVRAFMHHYPNHRFIPRYTEIEDELVNPPKVQGRRRPAKRQRKTQASTSKASKETN